MDSKNNLRFFYFFLIFLIVLNSLILSYFSFIYISPDQSYINKEDQLLIKKLINSEIKDEFFKVENFCNKNKFRPLFEKLVFIVIDAFRSDFINSLASQNIKLNYNFSMPFLENLLNTNKGLSAISKAHTPTVTLPKLKSILSGSQSNFIDFLLNLNATEFGSDNLINQLLLKNKKIIFYGDDTWLQMFNKTCFIRYNETLSFFALDYTSVDTNVTENMIPELNKTKEWDVLILHYLGVDHIGHSYGGFDSKLMPQKLIEMDNVIKIIYKKLSQYNEDYLFVITGDHGMTNLGNHGGNTDEETNTGFIMINTNKNYKLSLDDTLTKEKIEIDQTDVSTILSFYLGLNLPNKSKGKLNLKVLKKFGSLKNHQFDHLQLCYFFKNSLQLQKMNVEASLKFFDYFKNAVKYHSSFLDSLNLNDNKKDKLIKSSVKNYDLYLSVIQKILLDIRKNNLSYSNLMICVVFQVIILVILFYLQIYLKSFLIEEVLKTKNFISILFIFQVILHLAALSSTSFIENENYYFAYITKTLILLHSVIIFQNVLNRSQSLFMKYFLVLFLCNLSFSWKNLIENSLFYEEDKQKLFLFCIIFISFVLKIISLTKRDDLFISATQLLTFLLILLFKLDTYQAKLKIFYFYENHIYKTIHLLIIFITIYKIITNRLSVKKSKFLKKINSKEAQSKNYSIVSTSWILLASLLFKTKYLPLIIIHLYLEENLDLILNQTTNNQFSFIFQILIYLYLSQCSFYDLGNSNSLSTFDVNEGFIGLKKYNFYLVSIQLYFSTYSLTIFWLIKLIEKIYFKPLIYQQLINVILFVLTIRLTFMVFYQIISIILQNHLFVWSVITPKLIYEFSITMLYKIFLIFVILVKLFY